MKKKWLYNYEDAENIASQLNISENIAEILNKRFDGDLDRIKEFVNAKDQKPYHASLLKDIDKASNAIIEAIEKDKSIVIYGDYDVDGTTGISILLDALDRLGAKNLDYYIPNRREEGYGLNIPAVEKLAKDHDLMITVDLGITADKEINRVKDLGMDTIVTDHHKLQDEHFPENALAVVNPKQGEYPYGEISGCVVALKLAERIYQIKSGDDNFRFRNHYLDLATLSIIADRVPLMDENRAIVKKQLSQLYETGNLGLYTLLDKVGKTKGDIVSTDVGYMIGPRINACGRMAEADIAVELFTTQDELKASRLVAKMERLNNERKKIVDEQTEKAKKIIEEKKLYKNRIIVVHSEPFDSSLAGIVSSRVTGEYHRPSLILNQKTGVGSARSIEGVSIFDALSECEDILEEFGGHDMAAGLTVKPDNFTELRTQLNEWAKDLEDELFVPKIHIDSKVPLYDASLALIEELDILRPFGEANPEPKFQSNNLKVLNIQYMGSDDKHVKLTIQKKIFLKIKII